MILDISDYDFKKIFNDEFFYLPIMWDGKEFDKTLNELYRRYCCRIEEFLYAKYNDPNYDNKYAEISQICNYICKSVRAHLDGFPHIAFKCFVDVMKQLMEDPLISYEQKGQVIDDNLNLYRATSVSDIQPYKRIRMFHTPFNMRSKVASYRYSIAGYPSLYLGTSLELCCEEIHKNPRYDRVLASRFVLSRSIYNLNIMVIDVGMKPQDLILTETPDITLQELNQTETHEDENKGRQVSGKLLRDPVVRMAYLLWYPLIAACSYIRTNKSDPFAAEYIVPQLLMQWVRCEMSAKKDNSDQLIGIRYFSCATKRSSDLGFNYVFPTSGEALSPKKPYCRVLSNAFKLTVPVYTHDYDDIWKCESALEKDSKLDFI